jgi:death on curing protein
VNRYLSFAEIVEINAEMVRLFGGTHAVRDPGGLHAAVGRPRNGYYSDILEEAAALFESLPRIIHLWMAINEQRSRQLPCF